MAFAGFFLAGVPPICITTGLVGALFWVFPLGVTVFLAVQDSSFHFAQSPFRVLALV